MSSQLFLNKGKFILKDVHALSCRSGEIKVRTAYSAFSSGTEFGELEKTGKSLIKRGLEAPEKVKKAYQMAKASGLKNTLNFVQDTQLGFVATGYSVVGKVIEVGNGIYDVAPGDLVACAGAQYAHHSTDIKVSKNLYVRVDPDIDVPLASTVTLGAIAMQGIRQANVALGESVAIIGLGVIGQLAAQIAIAAGAVVTGFDLNEKKLSLAKSVGVDHCINPSNKDCIKKSIEIADGFGYDKVIVCSSDSSPNSMQLAFEIARSKATVVMVGGVNVNLNRKLMYYKELNFKASMSYGPGRYERMYEEMGLEYPIQHVRWTEQRNMSSYLRVVKTRRENIRALIGNRLNFKEAEEYLNSEDARLLTSPLILIDFQNDIDENITEKISEPRVEIANKLNLCVVGAGGHVKQFLLPNLSSNSDVTLRSLITNDRQSALNLQKKYNFQTISSAFEHFSEEKINAIVCASRHSKHFESIQFAIKSELDIFVEKPTVNSIENLLELEEMLKSIKSSQIMYTGYNRAFSPHVSFVKKHLKTSATSAQMTYFMNSGQLQPGNWQYDQAEGGRNIGEAVHIYHLFLNVFDSKPISFSVSQMRGSKIYNAYDNFTVSIDFENGCVGTLVYTSNGSKDYPKENFFIFFDGKTITSTDYKSTELIGGDSYKTKFNEKGQKEILNSFIQACKTGNSEMGIEEQIITMKLAFSIENELRSKQGT